MARGWRELVFAIPPNLHHDSHECILQTDGTAVASIAVKEPMDETFYSNRPTHALVALLLEYVVVVSEKKFSVATV
jgi:hypothetical protein